MLKLQFKDQRRVATWLVESRYTIGRDHANDIILDEAGIDSFHAELRVEGGQVFVTDLASTIGTLVNGNRITQRMPLRATDTLAIGGAEMQFCDPQQELENNDGATAISPALSNIRIKESQPLKCGEVASGNTDSGWKLKATAGSEMGKVYTIPMGRALILGRSSQSDIVIVGGHVSRQHAELRLMTNGLRVKDLGSSNGSYLNRKRIDEAIAHAGDELRFDTAKFEVTGPEVAQQPQHEEADSALFRSVIGDVAVAALPVQPRQTAAVSFATQAVESRTESQPDSDHAVVIIALSAVVVMGLAALVGYLLV